MLNRKVQEVHSIQHDSLAFPVLLVILITDQFFSICILQSSSGL